jgi:polysaccharide chain length determinant protein (PEP-CTERM system associated)
MFFVGTLAFAGSFIAFLPDIYTASALILVEGQQIPEDYVRSTVRMPVHQRLYTISQQALSRSRLAQLSEDFHLYRGLGQEQPLDDIVAAIRKAISIDIKGNTQTGAVAFSIGYSGTDPQTVMEVANTLASFYIEENLRMREQQATGTSNFLQAELEDVKQTLEAQEQKVSAYRKLHLGELPEQRDANLKTLERLQIQLQLLSENLARSQERRNALVYQINTAQAGGPVLTGPDSISLRIQDLRRELAELRTRFHENYPDVGIAKQQLAALEEQLKNPPPKAADSDRVETQTSPSALLVIPLQVQVKELDGELRLLNTERASLLRDIAQYQARIENTPKREQELLVLTRDYESTRELYASLLKRQEEAKLAGNMEQRQKGEQLRILDPATYPESPSGPARPLLLVIALCLSLGVAAISVILWERFIDQSFHNPEDLEAFAKTSVLVALPDIVTEDDRIHRRSRRSLGAMAFAASLLILVAASYKFAANNERMVIKLGARANPGAPDVRFQFLR